MLGLLILGRWDLRGGAQHEIAGSVLVNLMFLLLAAAPFLWRQRIPLVVVAVVATILVSWAAVLYRHTATYTKIDGRWRLTRSHATTY